jgi:hypothetical protein
MRKLLIVQDRCPSSWAVVKELELHPFFKRTGVNRGITGGDGFAEDWVVRLPMPEV